MKLRCPYVDKLNRGGVEPTGDARERTANAHATYSDLTTAGCVR